MPTPITGPIALSQVNTELGLSATAPISLNDTNVRRLANKLTGTISLSDLQAASAVTSASNNINVFTRFGSPATVTTYKLLNLSTIGATAGSTALTLGQFATGSTIQVNNYGNILGYGGAANSGVGGDAINANYPNQTVAIYNAAGAAIYSGGGGGGVGGTGGTGGMGYYGYTTYAASQGWVYYAYTDGYSCGCNYWWGGAYCASGCVFGGFYSYYCYTCAIPATGYSSGGAGGAGGAGGQGQGSNQSQTNGSAGSGGAAGGTNAGAGGTGGTGGNGGGWGAAGANGATGATGASGNYTGGSGGSAGGAGGAAGRYLVKGSNSVTVSNYGSILGNLA